MPPKNYSQNFDPTYYGLSLLAPKADVPKIWALLALKAELDSVAHKVADPQMGYIRLKWWEEALQNLPASAHQHPILTQLASFSTPQINVLLAHMAVHAAEKLAPLPDWAALQRWAANELWPLWQASYLTLNNKELDKKYKPLSQLVALTRLLRQNLAGHVWLPQTLLLNAELDESFINYCKLLDIEWIKTSATPPPENAFLHDIWLQRTWFERFKKAGYKPSPRTLANPPLWLWRCWWHSR